MKTTATPHNDAEGFLKALASLKFQPARWDSPNDRQLDLRNKEGHPILRICIGYEGEQRPHNLSLVKLDGTRAQLIQWESLMSAHMPTAGFLALLKSVG